MSPTCGSPLVPTRGPTAVCESYSREKLIAQIGNGPQCCDKLEELSESPFEIINANPGGDSITFRIKQNFYNGHIQRLTVQHHVNGTGMVCDDAGSVSEDWSKTFTSTCFQGTTDVKLYAYLCNNNGEQMECNFCQVPSDMDNFVAYAFTLHCNEYCDDDNSPTNAPNSDSECTEEGDLSTLSPTTSPKPDPTPSPTCSGGIEMEYEESDINWPEGAGPKVVAIDETTGKVKVSFNQTFQTLSKSSSPLCSNGQVNWIAFVSEDQSVEVCTRSESICFGDEIITELHCDAENDYTTLTLYVSDDHPTFSTSENDNPGSCVGWPSDNRNVAKYKFLIPCKIMIPCKDYPCFDKEKKVRQLLLNDDELSMGEHYCSKETFPCGNDNNEGVQVCHYSTRNGYQTFCVAEEDSNMLAYYEKDYCGPCYDGSNTASLISTRAKK
jgi:hypothetical protein